MAVTRLLSVDDAEELTSVVRENRAFLAPWQPLRDEAFFTVKGQRASLQQAHEAYVRETQVPLVIVAVADVVNIAFKQLGLHRLQAETVLYNPGSQRVLTRNGFQPFAIAPAYLKIAGRWQDQILFQLLNSGE
jgi:ribosomal-protein-alanine N-acetyltransferase